MIEEMVKFLLENTDVGRKYARENELGTELGQEPVETSVKSGKTSRETGETGPETGKTSREPVEKQVDLVENQLNTSREPVEIESNRA